MKIKETIERECCQNSDLKQLPMTQVGYAHRSGEYKFCIHCGRHHKLHSFMDAAGSTDYEYRPILWPWEQERKDLKLPDFPSS